MKETKAKKICTVRQIFQIIRMKKEKLVSTKYFSLALSRIQ